MVIFRLVFRCYAYFLNMINTQLKILIEKIYRICIIVGQGVVFSFIYFCISPQTGDNQRNNDPSPTRFVLMLLLIQTTEEVFPNVRLKDELLLRITGFSTFQFIGFKFDRER